MEGRKHFFFEKKKQKTFDYFGFDSPGETEAEIAKFLGSFFQKRTAFCCLPWPGAGQSGLPGQLQKKKSFLP
jgi:hypothetical protein